jgi:hypothetical protein
MEKVAESEERVKPEAINGGVRSAGLAQHPLLEADPALKGRTRFFIELAVEHGPRLSGLVFLVAVHTNRKHRMGRRGRKNGWHQTAAWYGEQLGVSSRQVKRLMKQAAELGLVDHERTGRGLLAWVIGKRPWKWLDQHYAGDYGEREYVVGHYDTELSKGLGINAACILDLLERPTVRNNELAFHQLHLAAERLGLDEGGLRKLVREAGGHGLLGEARSKEQIQREKDFRRLDYKGVAYRLPWITEREADLELRRLHRLGLIERRSVDAVTAGNRGCRWTYYSRKCLQKILD